ncbi:MAG TPA: hypothetical protein VJ725_30950 [Thermoanaerobaculia bacterium]|nr:hypothetical protein [Thermoanaerobaculia bacterium]
MSASINETTFLAFLKSYFANKVVQNSIASKKAPVWMDMPKHSDGGGRKCEFTQSLKEVFTFSPTFSTAQTLAKNNATSPGLAFAMPWVPLNAPIRVSAEAEHLSKTDKVAYMTALAEAAATAQRSFHHAMSILATGTGFGEVSITPITYTSGASFTIGNGAALKFLEGMALVASDSIHGDTLRSATAANVTNVDPDTGIITTDVADLAGTLSWATGDFVFLAGARQNSATPSRICPVGLRSWIPEVRPVTDATISTLEGTARITRSYGQHVDGSSVDDLEACQRLVTKCVIQGNATDLKLYVSHGRYDAMATALRSDQRFVNTTDGNAGFLKLKVNASELVVPIVADKTIENDVGYALQKGSYDIVGAGGEVPHVVSGPGGGWFTVSDDNSKESRLYGLAATRVMDPAACGVVAFADLT